MLRDMRGWKGILYVHHRGHHRGAAGRTGKEGGRVSFVAASSYAESEQCLERGKSKMYLTIKSIRHPEKTSSRPGMWARTPAASSWLTRFRGARRNAEKAVGQARNSRVFGQTAGAGGKLKLNRQARRYNKAEQRATRRGPAD